MLDIGQSERDCVRGWASVYKIGNEVTGFEIVLCVRMFTTTSPFFSFRSVRRSLWLKKSTCSYEADISEHPLYYRAVSTTNVDIMDE